MTENAALSTMDYTEPELAGAESRYYGLSSTAWARIGVISVLMVALFWPNLRRLFFKVVPYWGEANWQHSFLIPLVGLYYLYLNREDLLNPERQPDVSARVKGFGLWVELQLIAWGIVFFVKQYYATPFNSAVVRMALYGAMGVFALASLLGLFWLTGAGSYSIRKSGPRVTLRATALAMAESSATWFGLYTLLWAMVFYAWSIWPGQNDFFKDVSMVVTLFAVVLMLCGWRTMRVTWFPILFLLCAIPWPGLVYSWVALPLQKLAASAAAWALRATGVDAARVGTKLAYMVGLERRELNVAEACAGLKSLMTFVSLGGAIAFLSSRQMWQKIIISLSSVPVAIFCNTMRVTGQGLMDRYVSEEWSKGFAHMFFGLLMLIPAFFLILLVAWVLDNLFIEEVDKRALVKAAGAKTRASSLVIEAPHAKVKLPPIKPAAPVIASAQPSAARPVAATIAAAAPRPAAKPAAPAIKPATPAAKPSTTAAPQSLPPAKAAPASAEELASVTQRLTAARAPKRIVKPAPAMPPRAATPPAANPARPNTPPQPKPAPREDKP
jgi:exosortase